MLRRSFVAAVVLVLAVSLLQLTYVQPAAAYPGNAVALSGHGWGHGRGMSQWGALGYAVDNNWNHDQILGHYYSNTIYGASAGNPTIGVRIIAADGVDSIVTSGNGFNVGGVGFAANEATMVRRTPGGFDIYKSGSCGGAGGWNVVGSSAGNVVINPSAQGDSLASMLQSCRGDGVFGYRGNLSVINDGGTQRLVNNVVLEDYLRGVVPRESPAYWGNEGGGRGAQALRAQAVAARSYVLASASYPYATTCDTISCQVYFGAYKNGEAMENALTNAAVSATAGQVRRLNGGAIARTEFSSSSGGYTAGGTFPAVVDEGDDYIGNSRHNWTASLPVADVQAKYPSIGNLDSIAITQRNGFGDWGGRVIAMTITGTSGSVNVTGAQFRAAMGLFSDWFQVSNQPSGGVNGYWLMGSDGGIFSFGGAQFYGSMGGKPLNQPVVTLAPRSGSNGYWLVAADGGIFAFGQSRFFGSMGGQRLNQPIVGAASTPSGDGYWLVGADGGIFAFGDAKFHGSMGGQRLNQRIVAMAPTPTGGGYWLTAADGGVFAFGDARFFGSTGGIRLSQPIVSMAASATGNGYWFMGADGGVFAYGDAKYLGGLPGSNVRATATSMARTATGNGYLITTGNGTVYSYGDAPTFGNLAQAAPNFRGTVLGVLPQY